MSLNATPSSRYVFVDAVRGLAALSVVLFHLGRDFLGADILHFGKHGVTVFFVISGFVIARSLDDKVVTGRFVGVFMLRRSVRLDPTYWVCLALAMLVLWVPSKIFAYSVSMASLADIGLHMVYLQDLAQVPPINIVFWTLCYEIQFYLVLCLIFFVVEAFSRRYQSTDHRVMRVRFLVPIFMASLLWPLGLQSWFFSQTMPGLFIDLWYLFLLGVFAYLAMTNKLALYVLFFAVILLLIYADSLAAVIGAGAAITFWLVGRLEKLRVWLRWRWLQFLGLISYSLYLSHDIVGIYLRDTGLHLAKKYLNLSSDSFVFCWVLLCIAFCIVFAYGLYKMVEKPTHELSRRIGRQHPRLSLIT